MSAADLPWPCTSGEPIHGRMFSDRGVEAVYLLHGPGCDLPTEARTTLVFRSGQAPARGRPIPERRRPRAA